ncbi:hypothetical protein JN080_04665 [Bacillus sp. EB600]|nr:hypothetical protein [Bacillus sp. EB600]
MNRIAQRKQTLYKVTQAISCRTVAKYREEIGIPGSSKRKRF